MVLTREREAELIEQNMPKIYRSIDNFMAKCSKKNAISLSYDDCVQEVTIAFLKYIRKCDSEEKLNVFPWYDALHAMSEQVLRSQPLSVPMSTSRFNEVIHSIPSTVSYEVMVSNGMEIDGMSKHWVPDEETRIDFDSFMASQPENIQRIAAMRLHGMTYRKIASQCGVSKTLVEKKIKRLRGDYDEFDKEDSEDE